MVISSFLLYSLFVKKVFNFVHSNNFRLVWYKLYIRAKHLESYRHSMLEVLSVKGQGCYQEEEEIIHQTSSSGCCSFGSGMGRKNGPCCFCFPKRRRRRRRRTTRWSSSSSLSRTQQQVQHSILNITDSMVFSLVIDPTSFSYCGVPHGSGSTHTSMSLMGNIPNMTTTQ